MPDPAVVRADSADVARAERREVYSRWLAACRNAGEHGRSGQRCARRAHALTVRSPARSAGFLQRRAQRIHFGQVPGYVDLTAAARARPAQKPAPGWRGAAGKAWRWVM